MLQGFIDNRRENSLTSRYWKVYQNPKEAEKIFDLYDRVKEQALKRSCADGHCPMWQYRKRK
ncbi:MAG: DUF3793 family protein [Pilosibacter sp.]